MRVIDFWFLTTWLLEMYFAPPPKHVTQLSVGSIMKILSRDTPSSNVSVQLYKQLYYSLLFFSVSINQIILKIQ